LCVVTSWSMKDSISGLSAAGADAALLHPAHIAKTPSKKTGASLARRRNRLQVPQRMKVVSMSA